VSQQSYEGGGLLAASRYSQSVTTSKSITPSAGPTLNRKDVDIGRIINALMTPDEICNAVANLSDAEKYELLKNPFVPGNDYQYSAVKSGGCNRSFRPEWLEKYPWLVFSHKLEGAFCKYCTLFVNPSDRPKYGQLVNSPFITWHHLSKHVTPHQEKKYHKDAVLAAGTFLDKVEKPETTLPHRVDEELAQRAQENRQIIKYIIDGIVYCAKQGIALRGRHEGEMMAGGKQNPGNFLAYLKSISKYNPLLKQHLEQPKQKNATYISATIQNEIIDIIGNDILLPHVISRVKAAKHYAVLADEVSSHNKEIMAVCLRYVSKDEGEINEDFISFTQIGALTGASIGANLIQVLTDCGLDVKDCRGQGYDGASNMSSQRKGVQSVLRAHQPLAAYVHCNSHILNLVISHSCSQPEVRNVIDKIKTICTFFNAHAPKRERLLNAIIMKEAPANEKRKALINLCQTRWAEQHVAYSHFYNCYVYVVKALEVIGYNLHADDAYMADDEAPWDQTSVMTAQNLLRAITSYDFIVTFLWVYHMLSNLQGITVKLQSKSIDIFDALGLVEEVKETFNNIRDNINDRFHRVYEHATRVASSVNVEPQMPRICSRMTQRSNAAATNPEEYFRINMGCIFLDHIISELETRFSSLSEKCSKLIWLVPSVLCERDLPDAEVHEIAALYSCDLPSPELIMDDVERWKNKFKDVTEKPASCVEALKLCDDDMYPNLHVLLRLACTLPVTSCQCERSASTLRRLHNFMRVSMNEERLSALALIHMHYEFEINYETVIDKFITKHPRRLEMGSLL
jgi:hypothetical protein